MFIQCEVSEVSELNTLVLQNNCLLYAWIYVTLLRNTTCGIIKVRQTDDATKYAKTNICKEMAFNLINFVLFKYTN